MTPFVYQALAFASERHKDQTYGSGPFTDHLEEVLGHAILFGCNDEEVLAACVLHDIVEDTDVTLDELRATFGDNVADMVDAVTDSPKSSLHPNRRARKERTWDLIAQTPGAIVVKLADRCSNFAACMRERPEMVQMYSKSHGDFMERLWSVIQEDEAALVGAGWLLGLQQRALTEGPWKKNRSSKKPTASSARAGYGEVNDEQQDDRGPCICARAGAEERT